MRDRISSERRSAPSQGRERLVQICNENYLGIAIGIVIGSWETRQSTRRIPNDSDAAVAETYCRCAHQMNIEEPVEIAVGDEDAGNRRAFSRQKPPIVRLFKGDSARTETSPIPTQGETRRISRLVAGASEPEMSPCVQDTIRGTQTLPRCVQMRDELHAKEKCGRGRATPAPD